MSAKKQTEEAEDLLGDGGDDLIGDAPAKPAAKKGKAAKAAAPKAEKAAKPAAAAAKAKGKKGETLADLIEEAPKGKGKKGTVAAPANVKNRAKQKFDVEDGGERSARGEGKFYFPKDGEDYKALRSKLSKVAKPASTKELAEKFETETWKVRRALTFMLEDGVKGKLKKEGSTLTYIPA